MSPTPDAPTVAALTPVENQQIQTARSSAASVVAAARDLVVEDQEQASRAGEILRDLATVRKRAESERKDLTAPYRSKVETINAQYKQPSAMLDEADKTIRAKVQAWTVEQERLRAIRQAELDAEAERQRQADEAERDRLAAEAKAQADAWDAEVREREALAAAVPGPEADANVAAAVQAKEALTDLAESRAITPLPVRRVETAAPVPKATQGVSTRRTWTFEVEDPAMVVRQFVMVDEAKVRRWMHDQVKAGDEPKLTGIRFWQSTEMSVRGR